MLFPIDPLEAVDIDYIQDFYYAEFLLKNRVKNCHIKSNL